MKVAALLRPDADSRPGGDVVQARAVARFLRAAGITVEELSGWHPRLRGFDAAILMNLTVPEQAWLHAAACRRAGVPYLLLPVFWDLAAAIPDEQRPTGSALLPVGSRRRSAVQRVRLLSRQPAAALTAGAGLLAYLTQDPRRQVVDVVAGARGVYPNSGAELEHLAAYTSIEPASRWKVVHNGIWVDDLPSLDAAVTGPRDDVVLSVGGISPRKNTLGLVRAARQLDWPVVVVGQRPRATDAYAQRVLAEAPANVDFVGLLPREDVLQRMARARVHVQPGFVETPGLASLEALALATPVVVSDTLPVREYFGDDAAYADPQDVASMVAAIHRAWTLGPRPEAAARVRRRFDWSEALRPILDDLRA
jgi:glycosyltransferase involved in cell wall biosynthesis